jgi:hypothetical protein
LLCELKIRIRKFVTLFILLAMVKYGSKIGISGASPVLLDCHLPGATVLVKGTTNGRTTDF